MSYINSFFTFLSLIISCWIPIVFWGYFFSFSWPNQGSKNMYFYGIWAWMISTFVLVWLNKFAENIPHIFQLFPQLHWLTYWASYFQLFLSFQVFFIILLLMFFLLSRIISSEQKNSFFIFLLSFISLSCIVLLFLGVFYIFHIWESFGNWLLWSAVQGPIFLSYAFNTIGLLLMYYISIAILEEWSKYFAFLAWNKYSFWSIKEGVLFAIFIALGFSFFENLLYVFRVYEEVWYSSILWETIVLRSIFSLFVHSFCAAIFWYFFAKIYSGSNMKSIKILSQLVLSLSIAIIVHASYDISMTLLWWMVAIVYFIFWYLYISKLLFSEAIEWKN